MCEVAEAKELRAVYTELEERWQDPEQVLCHALELVRQEKAAGNGHGHPVLEELPAWVLQPRPAVAAPVEEEAEGGDDGDEGGGFRFSARRLTLVSVVVVSILALALDVSPFDPFGSPESLSWSPLSVLAVLLAAVPTLLWRAF